MANEGGEWIMKGLSAEEHVSPRFWWTGDPEQDPWEWREIIPATGGPVGIRACDQRL